MAGITKNFIVKNGLEVNGGLFIANTDNNKVGVGTSVLVHDFNVRGGIGVTNAIVTGITTVNELKSTYSQLGVATASYYRVGTTTVFETSGGLVSLSGIQTADPTAKATLTNVLLGGQVNINNLTITGVATFNNYAFVNKDITVSGLTTTNYLYAAGVSTFAGIATHQNTLFGTQLSLSGVSTLSSAIVGSAVTITSGGLNVTGIVTANNLNISGISTLSSTIVGSAVTITSGGINLTGVGTIRNINSTQITSSNLNISGVSTLSAAIVGSAVTINSTGIDAVGIATLSRFVKITNVDQGGGLFAGIITAANGGQKVVYFGDGSNLTGVNAAPNLGISTAGGFVGSGVTLLNFRGSGVSTVFTNFTAGIGTIFIEGGTVTPGGSNTQVQFNNAGVLGGSSNFTFDGTGATIGTSRFNGSGINAGIITGTSFSGSGSGITGLTNSNLSGSAGITNANLANSTISGISLGGTLGTLTLATSGTGLSGSASYTGATGQTFTVTSNATSANTVSTIVARDASGNFNAGTITATFSGNLTGNVTGNLTSSGNVTVGSAVTITSGGADSVGVSTVAALNIKNTGGTYITGGSGTIGIGGSAIIDSSKNVNKITLVNYAEKVNAFGNTGTAATINLENGLFVTATLTGNCTFAFSLGNGLSSGAIAFTLQLTNDATAGRTITWPASVKWPNATVPTRTTTAGKTDVYTFYTTDGGANWWGNLSLYNFS